MKRSENNLTLNYVNHIILITDGHTYGDEENCIALAKTAAEHDIGISGLGIGIEWNDEFVDQLMCPDWRTVQFIQDLKQVKEFLEQSIASLKQAYSSRLTLEIIPAPGVNDAISFQDPSRSPTTTSPGRIFPGDLEKDTTAPGLI